MLDPVGVLVGPLQVHPFPSPEFQTSRQIGIKVKQTGFKIPAFFLIKVALEVMALVCGKKGIPQTEPPN